MRAPTDLLIMWRILFFIVVFYFLSSSENQLLASESGSFPTLTALESRHKTEDSLIKTEPDLPKLVKTNSQFIHLPELDKHFPLTASKKSVTYPEFSFDRIANGNNHFSRTG